jgi:predicted transcriptional regulator
MGRRSRFEIILNVLNVIQSGDFKPTRIMFESNLSWKICNEVLDSLIEQGLVEAIDMEKTWRKRDKRTHTKYIITSKGQSVLRYFQNINTMMGTGKKVNSYQIT